MDTVWRSVTTAERRQWTMLWNRCRTAVNSDCSHIGKVCGADVDTSQSGGTMGNDAQPQDATASVDFQEVQQTERFKTLRKRHRSFVFPMAVVFLLWYFAYVLLADYAVGFMSIKVWGNINVGLILGLLQFVTTFGITAWYVSYSNRKLDPIAAEIRNEIEGHEFDKDGNVISGAAK
jgi:uncharacterized membrane protein (DUF485 family)